MNSAVVYKGHVYCVSERAGGQLMCFNLRDGAVVWAERSFAPYGTLMIAGGRLVVLDEKGDLVIADATPGGYRELARAKVLNSRSWVMPVLANGRIYAKANNGETFLQHKPYKLRGLFLDVSPCFSTNGAGLTLENWCHTMSI